MEEMVECRGRRLGPWGARSAGPRIPEAVAIRNPAERLHCMLYTRFNTLSDAREYAVSVGAGPAPNPGKRCVVKDDAKHNERRGQNKRDLKACATQPALLWTPGKS